MSSLLIPAPFGGDHSLRRFTVDEYYQMIKTGILDETDRVELLDGYVVLKMTRNPPHDGTIDVVGVLLALVPPGWFPRSQEAITLPTSVPEPDLAVVRGTRRTYLHRHPTPGEVGLVVEIAESTLQSDRTEKGRIYAHADLPISWIINLVDGQVEVYSGPSGPVPTPGYAQRQDYLPGASVPLVLDGALVASIPVADLLP
jgi:Uma2 family endonuclease